MHARGMFSRRMFGLENCRFARMSSGQYCLIRDLGLVKGGKGLRYHEVVLQLSWRGIFRFVKERAFAKGTDEKTMARPALRMPSTPVTRGTIDRPLRIQKT